MPTEKISFTCSYLPVTCKCMWDSHCTTLCRSHTYSSVDASTLLALATTGYTPITLGLCSHRSAKHFNPSLSPRPWRQAEMIIQRQVNTQKRSPMVLCCFHALPMMLHGIILNIVQAELRNMSCCSDAAQKATVRTLWYSDLLNILHCFHITKMVTD